MMSTPRALVTGILEDNLPDGIVVLPYARALTAATKETP